MAVSTSDVALGISREEAERRALHMLETLGREGGASLSLSLSEDLADVLHALVQELARSESMSEGHYEVLRDVHRLLAGLAWPRDEFAEKAQLLIHISQLAWSQSLKQGDALPTRQWEQECLKYFLSQESTQQLVGMPVSNWSPAVCERFLSDRAFLLALCVWLNNRTNSDPRSAFELASVVYGWLSTHCGADAARGEEAYLLALLSCVLAGASRLRGQYRRSREWLRLAEGWCKSARNSGALQARIEYLRLAILSDMHEHTFVLARVPRVIERFEELCLEDDIAKSKLLQAVAHKELGGDEALKMFSLLNAEPAVMQLPWLRALVLVHLAELQSRAGDLGTALSSLKEAGALLQDTELPLVQAHCCGVTAEILRDHGKPVAAVEYYRRAVEIYLGVDMKAFAAYTGLVLAETLVATGRVDQAVNEILAALPIIESEHLVREGIAAVGLLKASLSRRKLDSDALKALRDSLDRSREEAEP